MIRKRFVLFCLAEFFFKHPALMAGMTLYFSAFFFLGSVFSLLYFSLFIFPIGFLYPKRALLLIILFFLSTSLFSYWHLYPKSNDEGRATLVITEVREKTHLFDRKVWELRGNLKEFISKDGKKIAAHIPYVTTISEKVGRPEANALYEVEGSITIQKNRKARLRVPTHSAWKRVKKKWASPELRFHLKKRFQAFLEKKFTNKEASRFLGALVTGDLDDSVMRKEFSRLGLTHLLAISGFHFSLLAFFFYLLFKIFLEPKKLALLLLFLLTGYLLFIGKSASIERSYIMIATYLISGFLKKRYTPLNSLGIAAIVIIIRDPTAILEIGFQFSFLATGAILLLYSPIEKLLEMALPKRPLSTILAFSLLEQHALLLLAILRKSLSLTLSITLALAPLLLFYFHNFPLISLLINLFFPFLVSISLFLLFLALIIPWDLLHSINNAYTSYLLTLTAFPPTPLNKTLWISSFPLWLVIPYLIILFLGAIILREYTEKKKAYGAFSPFFV